MRGVFVLFLMFISLRGCAEEDYYVAFSMGAAKKTVDSSSYLANQNGLLPGVVMVPFSSTTSTKIIDNQSFFDVRLGVSLFKTETFVTDLEVIYEHDPVKSQKTIGYEGYFENIIPGMSDLVQQTVSVCLKTDHWVGVAIQVRVPITDRFSFLGRAEVKQGRLSYTSSLTQEGLGFLGNTRVRKTIYGAELGGGGIYQIESGMHVMGTFSYFWTSQKQFQHFYPQPGIDYQPKYKQQTWKGKIGVLYQF